MKSTRRGSSLFTTVTWLAAIATLGFALASLSVQHLNATSTAENRQEALLAARSAVSAAVAELMQDTDFGKKPAPPIGVQRERARGLLSFSSTNEAGIVWSVNNLEGSKSVEGPGGRIVPKNSAYLIGEGRCGNAVRRVEAAPGSRAT